MTKLAAFNQKCLYYNVGNNFVSVESWKYCFQTWGYINCKIFLRLHRLPPNPSAIYLFTVNELQLLAARSHFAWILPICIIVFLITDQCWMQIFFLSLSYDKALILKHFLILSNTNTKVWKMKSKKWVWLIWVFM